MPLMSPAEHAFAKAISKLVYVNPFLPDRIAAEREALGDEFREGETVWSIQPDSDRERSNIHRLQQRVEALAEELRRRLAAGTRASREELTLYEDLVVYLLYYRTVVAMSEFVLQPPAAGKVSAKAPRRKVPFYRDFVADEEHFFNVPGVEMPDRVSAPHLFACFFQIRRAFYHIFSHIVGGSLAAARLRASAWQSIFTHDLRRYWRVLHRHMGDIATLIVGASGTGKEIVARAIGLSRYIPFDPETQSFAEDFTGSFYPLNLSALSPTLIESELFGHRRGAFTGALEDRAGWLEVCPPLGTVFLDEIGDVGPAIQVKLLRVLHSRTFQRLGDTETRRFGGKVIAATNRDLSAEMRSGRFREDFYYRLCSDIITTPTLREQLAGSPQELHRLVLFIARNVAGEEAEHVAGEVERFVERELGHDYAWPGNFRELEQCVRNVMIRREYRPPSRQALEPAEELAEAINAGSLTADELLRRYVTLIYARTQNYEETARRLGLDRRTVKAKVDPDAFRGTRLAAGG